MHRNIGIAVLACISAGVMISAASSTVVTNPTPAVSATMQLVSSTPPYVTWSIQGKVKPSYRGFGANVLLVCSKYEDALNGTASPPIVFGTSRDPLTSTSNVDACGNFAFNVVYAGESPQLDPSYYCVFVVHVDQTKAPRACDKAPAVASDFPSDPNGTAPCSGGFCPDAP